MSYAHKITRATFNVLVLSLVAAILGYFLRIYLAHSLSVENFGLFYSVLSLTTLLFLFKDFGLGPALAKYIPEFYHKNEGAKIKPAIFTSYVFQFLVGIVITVIVMLASPYLAANFFKTDASVPVLLFLMVEFLFASTTVKYGLQGLQFIKSYALMEVARISVVILSVLFLLEKSAVGVASAYLLSSIIVQIIFSAYILSKTRGAEGKWKIDSDIFYKLFKFGSYFLYGGIAGFLLSYTDTLALTALRTLGDVGLYQVAISTSQVMWGIAIALSVVLMPMISEMWAKNEKEKVSKGVSFLLKYVMIVLVPAFILMATFSEIVINILFGSRYLGASTSLQILSFGAIFYSLMTIYSTTLSSVGRPDISTKITIGIGALNLVGNVILVQIVGVVGAAIATTSAYFVGFCLYHINFRHLISVHVDKAEIAKIIAGALLALALVYGFKEAVYMDVFVESIISIFIAIVAYSAFIVKSKIIKKDDLLILKASRLPIPNALFRILERNSR